MRRQQYHANMVPDSLNVDDLFATLEASQYTESFISREVSRAICAKTPSPRKPSCKLKDESYKNGYNDGYELGKKELKSIISQQYYDSGVKDGKASSLKEIKLLKQEIEKLKAYNKCLGENYNE